MLHIESTHRIRRYFSATAACWAISGFATIASAQVRSGNPDAERLLNEFRGTCRSMNVKADNGSKTWQVYAWTDIKQKLEPKKGNMPQVVPIMQVYIMDSEVNLKKARNAYKRLQEAFARFAGDNRYRRFPFEDKAWKFENFGQAQHKAREMRRKSAMAWWPEVLGLGVRSPTGAKHYFVFSFRPINVQMSFSNSRGDDQKGPTYLASKGAPEAVIFDDAKVLAAAGKRYREYVNLWSGINDGRGTPVGRIEPVIERFSTFSEARQRARELGAR